MVTSPADVAEGTPAGVAEETPADVTEETPADVAVTIAGYHLEVR